MSITWGDTHLVTFDDESSNLISTTTANTFIGGGGFTVAPGANSSVYIQNGHPTYYTGCGTTGVVSPFTQIPLNGIQLPPTGREKLNPGQWNAIMRGHQYLPMEGTELCLICYALDEYRGPDLHMFVICEE